MYTISVIIPTYNREKYIRSSLLSVLGQKGQGDAFDMIEVIVVDDCSSDNTEEVIRNLNEGRIIYKKLDKNSGPAAARNAGAAMAKGDWIAFQDSDDKWHEDKLIKQIEYLNEHPEISMVSHPVRAIFEDGNEIITQTVSERNMVPYLAERNYYDTPTMLIKNESFLATGGFDPELKALEDWEFALRFADRYIIGMVSDVLIDSKMMSNGVSSSAANYFESRCRMISKNRDILIKHDCFDSAVKSLLIHAKKNDVFDMVGKMLELYLTE